jgi:hypothetical protein
MRYAVVLVPAILFYTPCNGGWSSGDAPLIQRVDENRLTISIRPLALFPMKFTRNKNPRQVNYTSMMRFDAVNCDNALRADGVTQQVMDRSENVPVQPTLDKPPTVAIAPDSTGLRASMLIVDKKALALREVQESLDESDSHMHSVIGKCTNAKDTIRFSADAISILDFESTTLAVVRDEGHDDRSLLDAVGVGLRALGHDVEDRKSVAGMLGLSLDEPASLRKMASALIRNDICMRIYEPANKHGKGNTYRLSEMQGDAAKPRVHILAKPDRGFQFYGALVSMLDVERHDWYERVSSFAMRD